MLSHLGRRRLPRISVQPGFGRFFGPTRLAGEVSAAVLRRLPPLGWAPAERL